MSNPDELALVPLSRRCTAMSRTSGYQERCKKPPINGATVCREHGGAAPQVKRKAEETLLAAREPAAAFLARLIREVEKNTCPTCSRLWANDKSKLALRAACEVLNRTGLGPTVKVALGDGRDSDDRSWMQFADADELARMGDAYDAATRLFEATRERVTARIHAGATRFDPAARKTAGGAGDVIEGYVLLPEGGDDARLGPEGD